MKHPHLMLAVLGLTAAALPPLAAADVMIPLKFSPATMDQTADPRVDFNAYANGGWLKATEIPADKSRWGAFAQLDEYNQAGLKAILETADAKSHEPGSVEQKVGDFFASAMDTTAIDAAGNVYFGFIASAGNPAGPASGRTTRWRS